MSGLNCYVIFYYALPCAGGGNAPDTFCAPNLHVSAANAVIFGEAGFVSCNYGGEFIQGSIRGRVKKSYSILLYDLSLKEPRSVVNFHGG